MNPNIEALISAGLFWLLRKYVLRKKIYMHHIVLIITVSIFMAGTANAYFLLLQYEQYHPNGSMPLVVCWYDIYVWQPGKLNPFVFILLFICMATKQVLT